MVIRLFLFCIITLLGYYPANLSAMDTKGTASCLEQELIDAIKRGARKDVLIRGYFRPENPINIDYQDADGNTPLMVACQHGASDKVIELLIDHNPSLAITNNDRKTVFWYVETQAILDIFYSKFFEKINLALSKNDVQEASDLLLKLPEKKVIRTLKEWAEDDPEKFKKIFSIFDAQNKQAETAPDLLQNCFLHDLIERYYLMTNNIPYYADKRENLRVSIEYLLQHGTDVNKIEIRGWPLFIEAVIKNDTALLELCLKYGADVNKQDKYGNTALMYGIDKRQHQERMPSFIIPLLNHPTINLEIKNNDGKTVFDIISKKIKDQILFHTQFIEDIFCVLCKAVDPSLKLSPDRNVDIHKFLRSLSLQIVAGTRDLTHIQSLFEMVENHPVLNKNYFGNLDDCYPHIKKLAPALKDITHRYHTFACTYTTILLSGHLSHRKKFIKDPLRLYQLAIHIIKSHNSVAFKILLNALSKYEYTITYFNCADTVKATLLHRCVQYDFTDGIKLICEYNDKKIIDAPNMFDNTPLTWAIHYGNTECIKLLLAYGCNPNPYFYDDLNMYYDGTHTDHKMDNDVAGINALDLAEKHCPNAIPLLQDAQRLTAHDLPAEMWAEIASHTPSGPTLVESIKNLKSILGLVNKNIRNAFTKEFSPVSVVTKRKTDEEKEYMLWNALHNKQYKLFSTLLTQNKHLINSRRITKDGKRSDTKETFLIHIIKERGPSSFELIKTIVDAGIDVNATSKWGLEIESALRPYFSYVIIDDNHTGLSALDILLYRFADYSETNRDQLKQHALYLLENGGHCNEHIYCRIVDPSPTWSSLDPAGTDDARPLLTVLWLRGLTGMLNALELLICKSNIDINIIVDNEQGTIFHMLVHHPRPLRLLLTHPSINVNKINKQGKTALDILKKYHHDRGITSEKEANYKLLCAHGAKTAQELANPQSTTQQPSSTLAAQPSDNAIASLSAPPAQPTLTTQSQNTSWFKKPTTAYLCAAIGTCGVAALLYVAYKYWYAPEEDHDDEENSDLDDPTLRNTDKPVLNTN